MKYNILVNNKQYELDINSPITILQCLQNLNIHVPRFCYHERLSISGNCRMCLVEVFKAIKPVLACSTHIQNDMKIYTSTVLVKKAQETVMEFLLINHPLDCPICDQAGECDLQEVSRNFGTDRSRFTELKRSVEDIYISPIIETIMTRCIHCTRCIRFSEEVLNYPVLGMSGRGRESEVSTYILNIIDSQLSGNLIDLCPVGALTSKPYAFTSRPWELKSVESIDVLDSMGSNIRVDVRGSEVVRILPKLNESVNEEWISNKIRFVYDSFKLQRLTAPSFLETNNKYIQLSWEKAYTKILNKYIFANKIYFSLGDSLDLSTLFMIKKLFSILGNCNFTNSVNQLDVLDKNNYVLPISLENIENQDVYLLESRVSEELPLFKTRLLKKKNFAKTIYYIGRTSDISIENTIQSSLNSNLLIQVLEGRHQICYELIGSNPVFLSSSYSYLFKTISNTLNKIRTKYIFTRFLNNSFAVNTNVTDIQIRELGLINNISTKRDNNSELSIITYSIDRDISTSQLGKFNIFQGHHYPTLVSNFKYNLVLPTSLFIEQNSLYYNILGQLNSTTSAITRPIGCKHDKQVAFELLKYFIPSIKGIFNNFPYYMNQYHSKTKFSPIYDYNIYDINTNIMNNLLVHKYPYYYNSSILTSNSPILMKLTQAKIYKSNTFKKTL